VYRGGAVVLILVVCFGVLEAGFRVFPVAPPENVKLDRPHRIYAAETARRDADIDPASNPLRIAVVGDSFTEAMSVQLGDDYGMRLERLLNLNAGFLAVIFPLFSHDHREDRYPFRFAHEAIRDCLARHQVLSLDLLPAFTGLSPDRLPLQVVPGLDPHPSGISYRIAADEIFEFLLDQSLIDASYRPRQQQPLYAGPKIRKLHRRYRNPLRSD
jgi:hypothetical protein